MRTVLVHQKGAIQMSQHYTDPKREQEPRALPDIETWLYA